MYICICEKVSDKDIIDAIERGDVLELDDLKQQFCLGLNCGQCQQDALDLIKSTNAPKTISQVAQ